MLNFNNKKYLKKFVEIKFKNRYNPLQITAIDSLIKDSNSLLSKIGYFFLNNNNFHCKLDCIIKLLNMSMVALKQSYNEKYWKINISVVLDLNFRVLLANKNSLLAKFS